MSRTVTALYDSRSEAESAKERLSSTVDTDSVRILDHQSEASGSDESGSGGGWLSKLFMADDDRQTYHEGMKRGGFMLCAEVDSDEDADRIISLLEETSAVDLDERSRAWRSEGWQTQDRSAQYAGTSSGASAETSQRSVEEERIPIVEEQLNIGKRQVERGGARIHSFVRETPVTEQVSLHEENISVERRPVNETLSQTDLDRQGLFQDRDIEMHATGEEAVVGKEAHVTEEVVVRKTEGERIENVQDSVRHTEVDVERGEQGNSAFGFDGDSERNETQRSTSFEDERR